jgi:hypothetical protein
VSVGISASRLLVSCSCLCRISSSEKWRLDTLGVVRNWKGFCRARIAIGVGGSQKEPLEEKVEIFRLLRLQTGYTGLKGSIYVELLKTDSLLAYTMGLLSPAEPMLACSDFMWRGSCSFKTKQSLELPFPPSTFQLQPLTYNLYPSISAM